MAPQFTVTKGRARLADPAWTARATSSLPTPDFALHKDGDVRTGCLAGEPQDTLHRGTPADEVFEAGTRCDRGFPTAERFRFDGPHLEGIVEQRPQPIGRHGLDGKVEGACAHCRNRYLDAALGGQNDDGRLHALSPHRLEDLDPAHAGHDQIEDHGGDIAVTLPGKPVERSLAAIGRDRPVAQLQQ